MEACRDWECRLSAWFDGEAAELESEEVRSHLIDCVGCRATVYRWKGLRGELDLLAAVEPSEEAMERMTARFEQGLAAEVRGFHQTLRWINVAAALLLLLGVGFVAVDRLFLPSTAWADGPLEIDRAFQDLVQRQGTESSQAQSWLAEEPLRLEEDEAEPETTEESEASEDSES